MQIYLDNSATTRAYEEVAQAVVRAMTVNYHNPSSAYKPAIDAEKQINSCRERIKHVLGARDYDVVFTCGGTESDNLAILGTAQLMRKPMRFIYLGVEHPAVAQSMQAVSDMGHEICEIPVDPYGVADLDALESLLDEQTALVSCMHVNNETGAIQPIREIGELIKRKVPSARFLVDGVQGFLRVPIRLAEAKVDFYSLSAHKVHGPKGIGALLMRKGTRLKPQLLGGGQEKGLRSTTYNTPGIIGLDEAINIYSALDEPAQAMAQMKRQLWSLLHAGDESIAINGPMPDCEYSAPHILNVSFPGVRGEVMLHALEGEGIYVSTGSACSTHKMKSSAILHKMGIETDRAQGAIRVSLSSQNTMEEIEACAQVMLEVYGQLKQFRRR